MAASQTVPELLHGRKSPTLIMPRHGALTAYGYGIRICVERGHLTIEDGIGADRRKARLPRVGHGLRRLVLIGSDGFVSLSALRWLADQDAAFVMLDRDGSVLATTGPVRPSDARLRRAQALAHHSDVALQIVRELIGKKLEAQEKLARDGLTDVEATNAIARVRESVTTAKSIERVRLLEARAAHFYWNAWRKVAINFPKRDLHRVPEHWRTFGTRVSPLTGSPRRAANPVNAVLNYVYSILEAEARLAIAVLGLDPGLGVLHVDSQARDSLACDVMEPIRPQVDAYVLEWITHETLRRDWFFEQRDGSCRLMGSFAVRLSETAQTWATAVAPVAERIARVLWSTTTKSSRKELPPTRLTQDHRREARGLPVITQQALPPQPDSFCKQCGAQIGRGRTCCASCALELSTAGLVRAAQAGRIAAQSDQAQRLRTETQRRHAAAKGDWKLANLPTWLNEEFYSREIQLKLKKIPLSVLASTLAISIPYAAEIRSRGRVPHPRHWQVLANLVGVSSKFPGPTMAV